MTALDLSRGGSPYQDGIILPPGRAAKPSLQFGSATAGYYAPTTTSVSLSLAGSVVAAYTATGLAVTGTLSSSNALTVSTTGTIRADGVFVGTGLSIGSGSSDFGGNIDASSGFISNSLDNAVTATGTNQAGAYAITKQMTIVSSAPLNSGVRLAGQSFGAPAAGAKLTVRNNGTNTLTVYPMTSGTIDGGASVSLAAGSTGNYTLASSTTYFTT